MVLATIFFFLPSTHVDEERYIRKQMHNIIAMSNRIEHSDFFLVTTKNLK